MRKHLVDVGTILLLLNQAKLNEINAVLRACSERFLLELRGFAKDGRVESKARFAGKTERRISR